MDLSKRIIQSDSDEIHSEDVKEKASSKEKEVEPSINQLEAALNPSKCAGGEGVGGSEFMANDWEAYQKAMRAKKERDKNTDSKKISPLPPSPPASQIVPSTTSLVNSLKASMKSTSTPSPDIRQTTTPEWDDMAKSEADLTSSFNEVVSANSYVVSASQVMETLKTTESNYSDGWRKTHLDRRYKGKDKKHSTKAGREAWEELEGMEEGAVKVIKQIGETKKMLVDRGVVKGVPLEGEEKDGEEVKDWRKKLKQRRMGVEIKTKPKGREKEKCKDEWEEMLGMENEEVRRANKLKVSWDRNERRRKSQAGPDFAAAPFVAYLPFPSLSQEERRKAERMAEKKKLKSEKTKKKTKKKPGKVADANKAVNKEVDKILSSLSIKGKNGDDDEGDEDGM